MTVAIIDYGSGNLHSAAKAFERAARTSTHSRPIAITSDPDVVRKADRIILPGVGTVITIIGALLIAFPVVNEFIQGPFWLLSKIFVFLFVYVWMRGTLPRFRYDQLMSFGWKLLLPVSLANVVITATFIMLRGH